MLIEQVPSLPLCFPLINSAVPVWCFPPPVPLFVGCFASPLVSVPSVPAVPVAPPAPVAALCQLLGLLRAGGGSWHLCRSLGPLCAHTQERCELSRVTHARGGWKGPAGSWWPVWAGSPQLGQGLSPLCHLPGCCPHQCQCFHSLFTHPWTPCVQRRPSPSQRPICCVGQGEARPWAVFGEEQQ